ncbi:MAG: hypothetical protein INR71_13000 [Terriglobus roseus]|nr:hypothetical protein [Terriglobus roseus]
MTECSSLTSSSTSQGFVVDFLSTSTPLPAVCRSIGPRSREPASLAGFSLAAEL